MVQLKDHLPGKTAQNHSGPPLCGPPEMFRGDPAIIRGRSSHHLGKVSYTNGEGPKTCRGPSPLKMPWKGTGCDFTGEGQKHIIGPSPFCCQTASVWVARQQKRFRMIPGHPMMGGPASRGILASINERVLSNYPDNAKTVYTKYQIAKLNGDSQKALEYFESYSNHSDSVVVKRLEQSLFKSKAERS